MRPSLWIALAVVAGTNTVNVGTLTAGDLNNDGTINVVDLSLMYDQWFTGGLADYNRDGVTNSADYWIVIKNFFAEDDR